VVQVDQMVQRKYGRSLSAEEREALHAELGLDGSGTVDFLEFTQWMMRSSSTDELIARATELGPGVGEPGVTGVQQGQGTPESAGGGGGGSSQPSTRTPPTTRGGEAATDEDGGAPPPPDTPPHSPLLSPGRSSSISKPGTPHKPRTPLRAPGPVEREAAGQPGDVAAAADDRAKCTPAKATSRSRTIVAAPIESKPTSSKPGVWKEKADKSVVDGLLQQALETRRLMDQLQRELERQSQALASQSGG
jgi:hypothetical protein